jgi:hypothetical protein
MGVYELERYELYVKRYHVHSDSELDAVLRLYHGEAEPVDGPMEFVEVANNDGLPVAEALDLAAQLLEVGAIENFDIVIPSIRSIREVQ